MLLGPFFGLLTVSRYLSPSCDISLGSLLQESSEPHHGGMPRGLELSHVEPWVTTEKPWEIRRFRIHQEDMTDMMNSFKNMTTWYDRYEDMTTLEDVVRCGPNCDFSTWAEDAVPSHVKLEPWDETLSDFKSLLHSVLFSLLCCHYCNCYSWFATCTATRIARGDASLLLFPSFKLFSAGHFEGSRRASGRWKFQAEEIQLFRLISLEIAGLQAWTGWARGLIQVQEKLETRCQHGLKMLETVFVVFVCFHYLLITCDSSHTFGPGERSSHRDGCAAGATWYPQTLAPSWHWKWHWIYWNHR